MFPTSIVKEKQIPQDFTILIYKTKHYRYLQSKTDTAKSKVHDNSNATPQWFGPLCGAHIAAAMAAAAELKEEASSVHP